MPFYRPKLTIQRQIVYASKTKPLKALLRVIFFAAQAFYLRTNDAAACSFYRAISSSAIHSGFPQSGVVPIAPPCAS